ncbi:MAG: holo-[acyl-carrier-protein] synthase [Candidatus Omnitrophica bacterium CG07_land_8_20_14_0_80_42_15]|uniref:Holo-[acyl-carrier-protein] synthase n=1 Tax=Candidatus Aquitaenariimonas noxiae TaxID=1974741 RepID=A0A2J0L4R0_9BACT|nr:MAG: holo-[acyl-carrier-protein] synthase [Candidatus Omnitrophica bacterium CG07_land_8_20_14_0_80_42_15]
MIVGTGIDIVEVKRVKYAIDKWGNGFLKKVFTDEEIKYAKKRRFIFEHLAARFALKEAVLKAFGYDKLSDWKNIEISNAKSGKPEIKLHGNLNKLKRVKKISEIMVSMSHTKNYAVANAILARRG